MMLQNYYLFAYFLIVPMTAYPFCSRQNVIVKSDTLKTMVRSASSQPLFDLQKQLVSYSPVSPQAATMIDRTKFPADHNTGALNVSIPLHEIKMRDLSLPIVLSCKTTGIKTDESSGNVGLGWSIQAEPIITREVKGKPDEQFYTSYNADFGSMDIMYLKELYAGNRDEQPDIFYYSNLNNNGRFVFKRPQSYSESLKYTPIFIPAAPESFVNINFISGGFQMKDAKGNLYNYGDNSNYIEYTSNSSGANPATCWKASRIISARNDTILFTYNNGPSTSYTGRYDYYGVEDGDWVYTDHNAIVPTSGGYWKGVNGYLDYYYANGYVIRDGKMYVKEFLLEPYINNLLYGVESSTVGTKALSTIAYLNGKVVFVGSSDKLTSLQIYEKSTLIKEISFSYKDYNYQNRRFALTGIVITDKITNSTQTYSFDYYENYSYSSLSTKAIDYWGYYNGKEENTDMVPRQEISLMVQGSGDTQYAIIGGADREPNLSCAKTYTLKSITYPTGATDQLEYGLNKYKSDGVVKEAGGLRIEKITTLNRLKVMTEVRTFEYGLNGDESGLICIKPDLQFFCSDHQRIYMDMFTPHTRRYRVYSSQSAANLFYSSGVPVLYVDVVERRGLPNSMVRSEYHYNNDSYHGPTPGRFYPDAVNEWTLHKLLNRKDYLGDGVKLLKNIDYSQAYLGLHSPELYRTDMRMLYGYNVVSWHSCPEDNDHYYFDFATLTLKGESNCTQGSITETDYSGGTSLVNKIESGFGTTDWDVRTALPVSATCTNSDNTVYTTLYKYPYHYTSGTSEYAVAQRMIQNNDVMRKFEESYSVGNSSDGIKKLKYNYVLSGKAIPYQLNSLQISRSSTSDFQNVERYTRYDDRGNLTEYIRQDGCTVTILWGYNYQLPVAEIIGADYAAVSLRIPSYSTLQTQDGSVLQTTLNAIRSGLPSAMVTTYSYYPGRGVATKTDPSGKVFTYEYSGKGELLRLKDANGKTVESYEYKYNQ